MSDIHIKNRNMKNRFFSYFVLLLVFIFILNFINEVYATHAGGPAPAPAPQYTPAPSPAPAPTPAPKVEAKVEAKAAPKVEAKVEAKAAPAPAPWAGSMTTRISNVVSTLGYTPTPLLYQDFITSQERERVVRKAEAKAAEVAEERRLEEVKAMASPPRVNPCNNFNCPPICSGNSLQQRTCTVINNNPSCQVTSSQECKFGCENNACRQDPCAGVSCPDRCNGNLRQFSGNCVNGQCAYRSETCSYSCSAGICSLPPSVTNVQISPNPVRLGQTLTISWNDPQAFTSSWYRVYEITSRGRTIVASKSTPASPITMPTFSFTPGDYSFNIKVCVREDCSAIVTRSFTVSGNSPPNIPDITTISAAQSSIDVAWGTPRDPDNDQITRYLTRLYNLQTGQVLEQTVTSNWRSFTGLGAGTYQVEVSAFDGYQWSKPAKREITITSRGCEFRGIFYQENSRWTEQGVEYKCVCKANICTVHSSFRSRSLDNLFNLFR